MKKGITISKWYLKVIHDALMEYNKFNNSMNSTKIKDMGLMSLLSRKAVIRYAADSNSPCY